MRSPHLMVLALSGAIGLFGITACETEQVQEGRAPDVDVDIDPGRWPQYKTDWADVDVGTREKTVTVPVVKVVEETRQVSVPYIDINPPNVGEREERMIEVSVDVPHAGYDLNISEVRAAADDLWVIAQLTERDGAAAQAVTRATDQVVVNAPTDLDVRKVIVGQQPTGDYNQQHRFVSSRDALTPSLPENSRVIYQRGAGQM